MKTEPFERQPDGPGSRGTAPSSRRESQNRRRVWLWIALVASVALIAVGVLTARPAWRLVKSVRAKHFLAQSEEFIRKEQWTQAFERTRSALQLSPNNPQILRHAAKLHARFGMDSALTYYQQLVALPGATIEDKEGYAAIALGLGDSGLAGTMVEDLLEAAKPTPRSLLLGAEYYALKRDLPRAIGLARDCVTAEPGNPTNVLALASLLSSSKRVTDRAEALTVLWPHARTNGPFQLRALSAILNAPDSPRNDREQVQSILDAKASRSIDEDLLLWETQVSLDPSQRSRIADEVVQRFGHGTQDQVIGAAAWLNRQQAYDRTLNLLLPDLARKSFRLARLRYDALIGVDDIRGAYEFIRADGMPGDPIQTEFLRCTTALRLKDDPAVEMHLRNLLKLARHQPRQLRAIAEFARRNKKLDITKEASQILSRFPREAERAFEALLRTADAQGETWAARDYARKLSNLRKSDEAVKLQIAYYDLLLEENMEQAFATASKLQQAKPDDFIRRTVLALAYLRRKEPEKAAKTIEGQVVTWARVPPGARAVVVATMGSNQQQAAVLRLLERIPYGQLKAEERELIRPYLRGSPPAELEVMGEEKPEKL